MRYSGSKKRFAKYIVPILEKGMKDDDIFIDAFAGGMNIISEINIPNKFAYDTNKYVISLWNEIQSNGMKNIPVEVSEEKYYDIKNSYLNQDKRYPEYIIGYVGNCCSYGGAWWNGYAKFNPNKNENHILEAYNGLKKQVENFKFLKTTKFVHSTYKNLNENLLLKKDIVVYCDPPYMNTKKYESDFDNIGFWKWCRTNNQYFKHLYISEYEAPLDFKCIWKKEKKDGMKKLKIGEKQNIKIEKLFTYHEKR